MRIQEDKKIAKQLKKLQPKIIQKYRALLKELQANGLQAKCDMEKLKYNKDVMRIKLDYSYRVAVSFKDNIVEVLTVSTRENFYQF
jgi:mRNA-degrading endonuclease RelE of RelBE toxin-antitoxin system